jgi:hypothetical protein
MAAAGALAVASAGPAGAVPAGCPPAGAHVIDREGLVRVYSTGPLTGSLRSPIQACLAGRSGHMTLLSEGGRFGVSLAVSATSGPLVAYLITRFGVDSGSTVLRVADVSARRVLRELTIGSYIDGGILEREAPTRVVLGPEGAVGWIAASHGPDQHVTYTVRTAATIGPIEKLDEGPEISPRRLTLSGRRMGWWHDGTELHAPLA